eukprot:scaffold285_cov330-Pavlova_lutheri.AAC.30
MHTAATGSLPVADSAKVRWFQFWVGTNSTSISLSKERGNGDEFYGSGCDGGRRGGRGGSAAAASDGEARTRAVPEADAVPLPPPSSWCRYHAQSGAHAVGGVRGRHRQLFGGRVLGNDAFDRPRGRRKLGNGYGHLWQAAARKAGTHQTSAGRPLQNGPAITRKAKNGATGVRSNGNSHIRSAARRDRTLPWNFE